MKVFFIIIIIFWNTFVWLDNKPKQNSLEQPDLVDILFQTH